MEQSDSMGSMEQSDSVGSMEQSDSVGSMEQSDSVGSMEKLGQNRALFVTASTARDMGQKSEWQMNLGYCKLYSWFEYAMLYLNLAVVIVYLRL